MKPRRRIRVIGGGRGGLWWRIPCALALWLVLAAPVAAAAAAWTMLHIHAAGLPAVPDLDRWVDTAPRTSRIVAADGTIAAEIPFRHGGVAGRREPLRYQELPERVVHAFLAAEDERFFRHGGVDPRAIARAALANYRAGHIVQGASTITQQVARNLLPERIGDERTLRRKIREALLARRIERRYDKRRILEVYVNQVFLGAGAYGVAAAARAYFSASAHELTAAQAALIAGLAQAPGRADPFVAPEAALARRNEVLRRMRKAGFLDEATCREARSAPLGLHPPARRYGQIAPWHTERARRAVSEAMPERYRRGGLRIETTAEPALSRIAQRRARRWTGSIAGDRPPPQVAAVVWDHVTGYVEASIGGREPAAGEFDRAWQACRQPGSAFKPIVYAAALEADAITPGTPLRDGPIAEYDADLGVFWKPDSSGRPFRGVALAQDALAMSLNAPAVAVLDRVGNDRAIDLARRLGISTAIDDVRPMALGASCVVPIELAGAFATFARGGALAEPIHVERIVHGDEVLVDRASPLSPYLAPARRLDRIAATAGMRPRRALDRRTAHQIVDMLAAVVERGTGTGARRAGRPAAGKTGTTNGSADAWFVGFTGRVTVAVWVGHDDPAHTLGPRGGGSRTALPLWTQLVRAAERGRPERPVPGRPPPGLVPARVDRETGLLARPGAGGAIRLMFERGNEPSRTAGAPGVPRSLGDVSREF